MADINQFGNRQPSRSPDPAHCAQCEAMLADVLDRTLSPADQAVFDRHLAVCPDCSRMFIDARRGAEWMDKLRSPRPEPSTALLERILATTGPAAGLSSAAVLSQPNTLLGGPVLVPAAVSGAPAGYAAGNVIPFPQRVARVFRLQTARGAFMQPRLAMTAAMAFFSIALTLNLTGVHLTQLRASDLKPSSLKRSFYDANARVVRSIDNLRVVYELESRVQDLQSRDSDSTTGTPKSESSTPAPASSPAASPKQNDQTSPSGDQQQDDQKAPGRQDQQKQSSPRPRSGSSRSVSPRQSLQFTAANERQGSSPQPSSRMEQVSLFSTPIVFKQHQQGGQA